MNLSLKDAVGLKLLLAFEGRNELPSYLLKTLVDHELGGITLFRALNMENPVQVLELTQKLQAAAKEAGRTPLLIAVDQEGGQLNAVPGCTQLPGNMALGAAGSKTLAYKAGEVLGKELSALGIHINYAPCCDVNNNPGNPVIGVRSFGENPAKVAILTAAMVKGMQQQGVAACAKHFPGHGDTTQDSHHGLPVLPHSLQRLRAVEIPPFREAIDAGVQLVMTSHIALPEIDRYPGLPATLSEHILKEILRKELGFAGVVLSDAMNMQAIHQGRGLGLDAVCAAVADVDLLLLLEEEDDQEFVYQSLLQAAQRSLLPQDQVFLSASRVKMLKEWVFQPHQDVDSQIVNCADHRRIAQEIAERSITLVRDLNHSLPLRLNPDTKLVVVLPKPEDLTPADTSSFVQPEMVSSIRSYFPAVDGIEISMNPDQDEIESVLKRLDVYNTVILGTINAVHAPGQAELARRVLRLHPDTIAVALRLPYDMTTFPEVKTYLCTYSILKPSMLALAKILFGDLTATGRLPVTVPDQDLL